MKKVLLTGAAGIVGSLLRPLLREEYETIVLTDIVPIPEMAANEIFIRGDLADADFVDSVTAGVDAVIHLGACVGPDFTFDQVLSANIIGTHNVFASCRRQLISRVVYASSHHAVGFYRRDELIDESVPPRPDSQYGLSKAFGESVAAYYSDKFAIDVLVIRIGFSDKEVIDERRLHTWISPRDLMQLINIGLTTVNLGFEIVYGVSENPDPFFDNSNAIRLGYRPHDRSVDHLADPNILTLRADPTKIEGTTIGGLFTANGYVGDPERVLKRPSYGKSSPRSRDGQAP